MTPDEDRPPIPLEPAEDFPVTLDRHEHIPELLRPTWRFRFMTRRESRELKRIWYCFDFASDVPVPTPEEPAENETPEQVEQRERRDMVARGPAMRQREELADEALDTLCAFLQGLLVGWSTQKAGEFDPAKFDTTALDTDLMSLMVKVRAFNQMGPELFAKLEQQSRTHSAASVESTAEAPDARTPPANPSPPSSNAPPVTEPAPTAQTTTAPSLASSATDLAESE